MRTGLDIDGVLYPWPDSIYRYFVEFKGFSGTPRQFWDMFKSLDYGVQEYYVSLPTLYLDTSPTEDVLTYVPKIAELTEIFYITSRPASAEWATLKFFDKYNLPFKENLIFSKDKPMYVRLNEIEMFLDDLPGNVDKLLGVTDVYLFCREHNYNQREGYKQVSSLRQFYNLIQERLNES